jgi:hypothetical protein
LLATFWIVLKLLIEKEELFAGCEDEIAAAVGTLENLVDEIHRAFPRLARSTRSNSGQLTARPDRPASMVQIPACCDALD